MPCEVSLVIYDLSNINYYLHGFGVGAYHTTVHVLGKEMSYGFTGDRGSGV